MNFFLLMLPYIYLAAGLAALVLCGNWLVTGGVNLARYFKISALVVGLTIVAFGTSAPELFVSIGAALKGAPDISLGNVVGSNIANIALVLGLTAIICPIPINNKLFLFDILIMIIVTILLYFLGFNKILGLIEGIFLLAILAAFTVWSVLKEKRQQGIMPNKINEAPPPSNEAPAAAPEKTLHPLLAVLLIAGSVAGLYFGSEFFINGARDIARQWGVSERVIGISVVALGTSLPELAASIIAAARKEMDISIGNIVGSNIYNIAMVLGATSLIKPLNIASLEAFTIDMLWVFGFAVLLLLAILPLSKGKITRWKGGIFFALYIVYIVLLYVRQ